MSIATSSICAASDSDNEALPMSPIKLSADQLSQIMRCAQPLALADRDDFLRDVAEALNGHVLGDGIVARVAAAT
jgi:hypothetical protein